MGRELDRDAVVDIAPLGVVVELLGNEGDPRHKSERVGKVCELEGAGQTVFCFGPRHRMLLRITDQRRAQCALKRTGRRELGGICLVYGGDSIRRSRI